MNSRENRRFQVMLGLSVLLHGALFAVFSQQRQPAPVLPTIMASIRMVDTAPSGSPATPTPAMAAIPPKARQDAPRVDQRSTPRLSRTAGPASVPAQTVAPATVSEASPAPVAAPAAPVAVAETPRPAAPAVSAQAQSDMLANYRQRLTELFARGYEYPRVAAMRGWEGEVRLRLKVARKGNLIGVQLDHSSGFDVLDQHALSMLEGHGNLPPLPDALEGNEIQVIVPINYKLRKTT
ncbi:TonB family protein [Dechloromonas sp. XY25]|uniref:TonB family protein n=1 Tax=Dechloromonas hankyongensis TaxID=2908002 RepID=A0ABS9K0Z0_9RHOO|nr:TonB family protein [Dechloromonas hankyongensis]MCG2576836.1 TonB family protein [Dechloromonas hankyongensis]